MINLATQMVSSLTGASGVAVTAAANAGNGGPLSSAAFSAPYGLALDSRTGFMYVIEYTGAAIRNITLPAVSGSSSFTGATTACDNNWHSIATTFSGGGAAPQTVRSYLDGVITSESIIAVDVTGSASTPLYVGSSGEAAQPRQRHRPARARGAARRA